eukprot:5796041-Pleurochrysis_carterae.AAC.1
MGPKLNNNSSKGRRRAVVNEIVRFAGAESAAGVGDTSTVHRYGRGATSVLRVSAVHASRQFVS